MGKSRLNPRPLHGERARREKQNRGGKDPLRELE
jgi:hypothetical protein